MNTAADAAKLSRKQLAWTIFGLQATLLLAAMDQTVVATAMPKIIAELNGFERYAWVTTAYLLTSTTLLPIFGRLSDMFGRKWLLFFGSVGFVIASCLCGMAGYFPAVFGDGLTQLILFRGLQGIFGGAIMSVVFTVIADLFPPAERGKYQGLFSAVFALASVVGPALGGFLTDSFSWRAVFYINVPVGAISIAVLWFAFPNIKGERHQHRFDLVGVMTLIGWVVPLLLALTWIPTRGITGIDVLSMLALAIVCFVLFVMNEARYPEPIVPLNLFGDSIIAVSCVSMLLTGIALFGVILFVPLYFQSVEGVSATAAGTFLTPMMLMITVGSTVCGQLISRLGRYRWAGILGPVLFSAGMFLMAQIRPTTPHAVSLCYMVVVGFGLGLLMPLYTLASQNTVTTRLLGVVTSLGQFFRSIGGTLGAAVFQTILLSEYASYFKSHLPANVSESATKLFQNPLKLQDLSSFAAHQAGLSRDGSEQLLLNDVRNSMLHALDCIFITAAGVMLFSAVLNLFLKEIPLRKGPSNVSAAPVDEEIVVPPTVD